MRLTLLSIALLFSVSLPTLAQTRPARPGGGRGLDQLRTAMESLDLTDDQKQKVRDLMNETRGKLQALRGENDRKAMLEKAQPLVAELREKMKAILTPEQQEKLRDALGDRGAAERPTSRPSSHPTATPAGGVIPQASGTARPDAAVVADRSPSPLAVGAVAPSFTLPKSDGPNLSLAQFKGKVLLVVFGAYSSPTFRDHAPQLEQLRRDFGNKLSELVIYTREPHAKGEWEVDRNKDNGMEISQAKSVAERSATAKQMQQSLKLSVPVVVDSIENTTASAYGAEADTAVLIGRDGTILFRQKWFDPYGMRRAIESTLMTSSNSN